MPDQVVSLQRQGLGAQHLHRRQQEFSEGVRRLRRMSGSMGRPKAVFLHLFVESGAVDAQDFGSVGKIAVFGD